MSTFFRSGATALISGGASGVGFAMAQLCRKHGMHVALVDYNLANLEDAKKSLTRENNNLKTETYELDVGDLGAWKSILQTFKSTFPSLDLLMLNAGTSVKPTTKQPYEDVEYFHKTLNTNMYGVVNGLATFLPLLQEHAKSASSDKFGVIVTGSKQGITNPPGAANPAYNMSKAAIKTLAEHLAHDLRSEGNASYAPNVSVHLLIPGWTYTGLSGNPGPSPTEEVLKKKNEGAWLPAQVAEYAERKIGEGKFYIVCPDGDVDEALDMARMEWAIGDVIEGRSALSRWDKEFEKEAAEGIKKRADGLRK